MSAFVLTIRFILAAVFSVAGFAKLVDRHGSRQSLLEFGVPATLVPAVAVALPLAEVACALALLPAGSAWWGATGAVALLLMFIVAIAVNLARGRTPDCHCFGKLHSEPVGWATVARNGVLAMAAGFVVWQGPENAGPGVVGWFGTLNQSESMFLALAVAFAALAAFDVVMLVQLLAQNGRMMLRIEAVEARLGAAADSATVPAGLSVGSEAPAFSLSGLDGIPVTLGALTDVGKPVLLFFSEPGCSACESMLPDIARWQRAHAERLLIVPISRGDLQVNRARTQQYGLEQTLVQTDREVAEAFRVQATPSAVLLKDGLVTTPLAAGADEIRALVFSNTLPAPVKAGDLAPSLELRDLDDKPVNTATLRRRRAVLLFWNPSCGFCNAMLQDLKSWERTRPRHAPDLLIVSTGSVATNREQHFRSRVILDPSFGAGQVFGASGTPSAVLIDEQGRVASEVGVGAPAVLALLGAVPATNAVPV